MQNKDNFSAIRAMAGQCTGALSMNKIHQFRSLRQSLVTQRQIPSQSLFRSDGDTDCDECKFVVACSSPLRACRLLSQFPDCLHSPVLVGGDPAPRERMALLSEASDHFSPGAFLGVVMNVKQTKRHVDYLSLSYLLLHLFTSFWPPTVPPCRSVLGLLSRPRPGRRFAVYLCGRCGQCESTM